MILAITLKELLEQIPDNAQINAYEGEDTGINIAYNDQSWWIRCRESNEIDTLSEGFKRWNKKEQL